MHLERHRWICGAVAFVEAAWLVFLGWLALRGA